MHFAKRLRSEADRKWLNHYIDYKLLKKSIRHDVNALDSQGSAFNADLQNELQKVADFYAVQESQLESKLQCSVDTHRGVIPQAELAALRSEVQDLRKYVVLNYIAVVKAVKKRNRHLRIACGQSTPAIRAVSILASQYFYTSIRLAAMDTRTEIFSEETATDSRGQYDILEDFSCPICLNPLRSPVVLTCAHRFCWGCLISLASTMQQQSWHASPAEEKTDTLDKADMECDEILPVTPTTVVRPAVWESDLSDDDGATLATFRCPCCRKDQILDLDRLHVDPHLDAFMHRIGDSTVCETENDDGQQRTEEISLFLTNLEQQQQRNSSVSFSSRPPLPPSHSASAAAINDDVDMPQAKAFISTVALPIPISATSAQDISVAPPTIPSPAPLLALSTADTACKPTPKPTSVIAEKHEGEPPLLPPQQPSPYSSSFGARPPLTICLDLDGTLVTTFTPKRAPSLPPAAVSYIVGRGGALNPGGVFVVERPGLGKFLRQISAFGEIVLFTAGLEDYASPICDEIERRYGKFDFRLYRPATVPSDVYPCIKDLSRLGRDVSRCVLVDDTPLAFFRQPDNGIPVLQFRGDVDDRILEEAVCPLLEALANENDVTKSLSRRFNMKKWFIAQGLPLYSNPVPAKKQLVRRDNGAASLARAPSAPVFQRIPSLPQAAAATTPTATGPVSNSSFLLVSDFDKTLIDCDTAERLCDDLAPELTSLLTQIETPATFIPVTNTVLSEMQRRGVSSDQISSTLYRMASEALAPAVSTMIKSAHARNIDIHILSDANSIFIGSILAAAKMNQYVKSVITNPARFEAVQTAAIGLGGDASPGWFGSSRTSSTNTTAATATRSHRLVVGPRHDHSVDGHHGCHLCPPNLCKGRELDALRAANPHRRVVYAGDGANDLCPALRLLPGDVVLPRSGYPLEKLVAEHRNSLVADVKIWTTHEELEAIIDQIQ